MAMKGPELIPQLCKESLCIRVFQIMVDLSDEQLGHSMSQVKDYRVDHIVLQVLATSQSTSYPYSTGLMHHIREPVQSSSWKKGLVSQLPDTGLRQGNCLFEWTAGC